MCEKLGLPLREAKCRIKDEDLFPSLLYAGAVGGQRLIQQRQRTQEDQQQN